MALNEELPDPEAMTPWEAYEAYVSSYDPSEDGLDEDICQGWHEEAEQLKVRLEEMRRKGGLALNPAPLPIVGNLEGTFYSERTRLRTRLAELDTLLAACQQAWEDDEL